jgi:hypothetical protein
MAKNPAPKTETTDTAPATEAKDRGVPITIHLDRAVARKLKHAAIDADIPASKLVEKVLSEFLA